MDPLLQHLKPASPPTASPEAVKTFSTLRDLDLKTGISAGTAEIVKTGDGRLVQVPITLPIGQAELESYDRDYPTTSIPTAGLTTEELESKSRLLRGQIEGREDGMGQVEVVDAAGNLQVTHGVMVGYESLSWRVIHLGGNQWRVIGGELRYNGIVGYNEETESNIIELIRITIPDTDIVLDSGFVVLPVVITPDNTLGGYSATADSVIGVSSFSQVPPGRTITVNPDFSETTVYTAGLLYIPLAKVEAPSRKAPPKITHIFGKKSFLLLSPSAYGPGLPNVS